MNVANNGMLRRLYEIGSLHLNKFHPLPPRISVFGQLMYSMACFIRIQYCKPELHSVLPFMKMRRFSKRNHVNMSLFHNVFKRDIRLQVTKGPPVTSFARLRNSRWRILRTLKRIFNVKTGLRTVPTIVYAHIICASRNA